MTPGRMHDADPELLFSSGYALTENWLPICRFFLEEALVRNRNPLQGTYDVDATTGVFFQPSADGLQSGLGEKAFSLPMAVFDIYHRLEYGTLPTHAAPELFTFWDVACDQFERRLLENELLIVGRRGGEAQPFVNIGIDVWKRSYKNSLDHQSGPMNKSEWMALCIYRDELIGLDERIFSPHVALKTGTTVLSPQPSKAKPGRKPTEHWDKIVKPVAQQLMLENGEFDQTTANWNCQARLEKQIHERVRVQRPGLNLRPTQLRHYLTIWLPEWKQQGVF